MLTRLTDAVAEWPEPTNVRQVRQFLGLLDTTEDLSMNMRASRIP